MRGIKAKPHDLNGVSGLIPKQVKDQLRQSGIIQKKSMDGALQHCKTLVLLQPSTSQLSVELLTSSSHVPLT